MAKQSHKSNASELRSALLRVVEQRIISNGSAVFPCVPALSGQYTAKLLETWSSLGRKFSDADAEQLQRAVANVQSTGYEQSPCSLLVVRWEADAPPTARLRYRLEVHTRTVEEEYNEWVKSRPAPLFGAHPDAKVMNAAAELGEPHASPVLDVGAGTGRNALPLARLGHPTVAIEMVSALCEQLRQAQASEVLPLQIVQADFLSPELALEKGRYRLAVLSEVVTHFRDVAQLRATFSKLSELLAPGATLLFNAFLGSGGYEPDALAQQISRSSISSIFTRSDLAFLETELPFRKVSDESAHDYEKAHSAPEAWPPTNWYVSWSRGRNLFDVPEGKAPVELRWLLYRRC